MSDYPRGMTLRPIESWPGTPLGKLTSTLSARTQRRKNRRGRPMRSSRQGSTLLTASRTK